MFFCFVLYLFCSDLNMVVTFRLFKHHKVNVMTFLSVLKVKNWLTMINVSILCSSQSEFLCAF